MNVKIFIKDRKAMILLTKLYLFCMFSFFLFYYQDYYFDMTNAKYAYFAFVSVLFVSLGMVLCVVRVLYVRRSNRSLRSIVQNLSITDWGFLCFLCAHILTNILTSYPQESFSGSSGRHLGLFFTFLITLLYFLISRNYQKDRSVMVFQISLCEYPSDGPNSFKFLFLHE